MVEVVRVVAPLVLLVRLVVLDLAESGVCRVLWGEETVPLLLRGGRSLLEIVGWEAVVRRSRVEAVGLMAYLQVVWR